MSVVEVGEGMEGPLKKQEIKQKTFYNVIKKKKLE